VWLRVIFSLLSLISGTDHVPDLASFRFPGNLTVRIDPVKPLVQSGAKVALAAVGLCELDRLDRADGRKRRDA
jgi:hypothetical protein